jgi:hypothetical protein
VDDVISEFTGSHHTQYGKHNIRKAQQWKESRSIRGEPCGCRGSLKGFSTMFLGIIFSFETSFEGNIRFVFVKYSFRITWSKFTVFRNN